MLIGTELPEGLPRTHVLGYRSHESVHMDAGPQVVKPSRQSDPQSKHSFEALLAKISARFVNVPAGEVDVEIDNALRLVCGSLGVDESTIYLREIDNPDIFVLSYVLRDPELPPPPKIKFTAAENFPWCNQKLIANEIICLPDTQAAPPEAAIDKASWKKYNVWSALIIPLSTGGSRPVGFWGIDSTSGRRVWPEPLQKRLKIIADVFANALDRAARERTLRESEARLRLAAEITGAGFWTIDLDADVVWATPRLKELFGLQPDESVNTKKLFDIIHPKHRDALRRAVDRMVQGQEASLEYQILPKPGIVRWVASRGNRHPDTLRKGSLVMGTTFDITEKRAAEDALRGVSGRLIQAQEEERRRIARELHDGINQRVALLAVGLDRLRQTVPELNGRKEVDNLVEDVNELGKDIQMLSHQLHSSKLDYLGLVVALQSLCRELGERQQVEIRFTHSGIPSSLPPNVALALFRIAQEALHNALKYSGTRVFEVLLNRINNEIELKICDRGIGFDVDTAMKGDGLGLISMRERIVALEGTLSIRSQPMEGTEVRVLAPLSNDGCDDVAKRAVAVRDVQHGRRPKLPR
jgi:PAS domain S-box-containing protein